MNNTNKKADSLHTSVLLAETLDLLNPHDGLYIDATLGLGGHTKAILETSEDIKVIGIDQDIEAIGYARENLAEFDERIEIIHANFSEIKQVLNNVGICKVDGILADLGVSSLQLDSKVRGFSFRFDAPLDMRMDANAEYENAAEMLERLSEEEIADVIFKYGDERFSRRIARRIVEKRKSGEPVKTTTELAELVKRCVPRKAKDKIHPATKTFQALRIAVNGEIDVLEGFLQDSIELLKTDGRLVIISFHSIEDRIVKRTFQKFSGKCSCPPKFPQCVCGASKEIKILTRKPLIASVEEQQNNPRSRSAKLRACSKI